MVSYPVELRINNKKYQQWTKVSVTRALDALSSDASLEIITVGQGAERIDVLEDDLCTLLLEGEVIIQGLVVGFESGGDPTGGKRRLSLSLRDQSFKLVKNCPLPQQFKAQTATGLIQTLAAQQGIPVTAKAASVGGVFDKFAINPGETYYDVIKRIAEARGLLVLTDRKGGLLLTDAQPDAVESIVIEDGATWLKSISARHSGEERYAQVVVLGQSGGAGDDHGRARNGALGRAIDKGVGDRSRLVITAQGEATAADCQRQALWEMASRNGKAVSASVKVVGWRQPHGKLWDIYQLVRVRSDVAVLDETMVISRITYARSPTEGTTASLELVRPAALIPAPMASEPAETKRAKAKKSKKKGKKKKAEAAMKPGLYTLENGKYVPAK